MTENDQDVVETLVRQKRTWTEAAKCAEKLGSVRVADYCRGKAKVCAESLVGFIRADLEKGGVR